MTEHDVLDALHQLVVTSDGPRVLIVDASPLTSDPRDVRHWRLHEVRAGVWRHDGAGEEGPLGEQLSAIAAVYASGFCMACHAGWHDDCTAASTDVCKCADHDHQLVDD